MYWHVVHWFKRCMANPTVPNCFISAKRSERLCNCSFQPNSPTPRTIIVQDSPSLSLSLSLLLSSPSFFQHTRGRSDDQFALYGGQYNATHCVHIKKKEKGGEGVRRGEGRADCFAELSISIVTELDGSLPSQFFTNCLSFCCLCVPRIFFPFFSVQDQEGKLYGPRPSLFHRCLYTVTELIFSLFWSTWFLDCRRQAGRIIYIHRAEKLTTELNNFSRGG